MPRAWPPHPTDSEVMLYRYGKGGRNRERNRRIPCISPPLRFVLRLRLQKGARICGTLRYTTVGFYIVYTQGDKQGRTAPLLTTAENGASLKMLFVYVEFDGTCSFLAL